MPTIKIKKFFCYECGYSKDININDDDIQICPSCGNGLPDNQRTCGFSMYKGHTQIMYRDGSVKPSKEEIDEDIRTGKIKDKTINIYL